MDVSKFGQTEGFIHTTSGPVLIEINEPNLLNRIVFFFMFHALTRRCLDSDFCFPLSASK